MSSFRLFVRNTAAVIVVSAAVLCGGCGGDSGGAEAIDERPDDVSVIQRTAQEAYKSGDLETAMREYSRIAIDETLPPEVRSVGWTGRGIVGLKRISEPSAAPELRDEVRVDFMCALNLDRRNPSARYHLGLLYKNSYNRFMQSALDQFSMFVALAKGDAALPVDKANAYIKELRAEIDADLAKRPGADKANRTLCAKHLKTADAAFKRGKYLDAIKAYELAYKANPISYEAVEGLAKSCKLAGGIGNRKKAFRHYCEAASMRLYPNILIEAASLAEQEKDYASAVMLYSKALSVRMADANILGGLVRSLRSAGRPAEAAVYSRYRDTLVGGR